MLSLGISDHPIREKTDHVQPCKVRYLANYILGNRKRDLMIAAIFFVSVPATEKSGRYL